MEPTELDRALVRSEVLAALANESPAHKFRWRLGRRGAFLVTMGSLFVALGYGYGFTATPIAIQQQLAMPIFVVQGIHLWGVQGLEIWGYLWMVAGAVAVFTAWWPPGRDAAGFVALEAFSTVWAVLNILGAVFFGAPRAWIVGVIFLIYALSVLIVSGMPDPTPLTRAQEAARKVNRDRSYHHDGESNDRSDGE